jgi:hypothetical protein
MSIRIDDFKSALQGGVRPNLFRVIGGFPSGATGLVNAAAGLAGALGAPAALTNAVTSVSNAIGAGGSGRQLSFLVSSATIPEEELGTITVPFSGRELKLPGDRVFSTWKIRVYNEPTWSVRSDFERWSQLMNDHVNNIGAPGLSVAQQWKVQQLDRTAGNVIKEYILHGCWVKTVAAIELNMETQNTIQMYDVDLEYQYWTSGTPGATGVLNAISSTIAGL